MITAQAQATWGLIEQCGIEVDADTAIVTARLRNGTRNKFPIDTLPDKDQAWVREQAVSEPSSE